jgi:hypothetical protein
MSILKKAAIIAFSTATTGLCLAAPAGADVDPCHAIIIPICRFFPMAPDLDHDVDLTQDPDGLYDLQGGQSVGTPHGQGGQSAGTQPDAQGGQTVGTPHGQGGQSAGTQPDMQGGQSGGTQPDVQGGQSAGTQPDAGLSGG